MLQKKLPKPQMARVHRQRSVYHSSGCFSNTQQPRRGSKYTQTSCEQTNTPCSGRSGQKWRNRLRTGFCHIVGVSVICTFNFVISLPKLRQIIPISLEQCCWFPLFKMSNSSSSTHQPENSPSNGRGLRVLFSAFLISSEEGEDVAHSLYHHTIWPHTHTHTRCKAGGTPSKWIQNGSQSQKWVTSTHLSELWLSTREKKNLKKPKHL